MRPALLVTQTVTRRKLPCYRSPGETLSTRRLPEGSKDEARRLKAPRYAPRSGGGDQIHVEMHANLATEQVEQNGDPVVVSHSVE